MVEDNRHTGEPRSGFASFASGDSGTSKDVLTARPEVTLSINDIAITYSTGGSTNSTVSLYDDEEGTAQGDLSNQIDQYEIAPGDSIVLEDVMRDDIENDIVAVVDNNDSDVTISIGTGIITG